MKSAQNKTNATTAQPARKSGPFFGKDPRQSFFKPAGQGIQRKLTVGAPNDVYEKEADHMADRVVSGVQRKPIFESKNDPAEGLQRKCAACEKDEKVQKKAAGAARSAAAPSSAAPSVESGISRSKGSGSSLPSSTRNQMESSFGTDFSDVKIHQDSGAKQMNKDLNAQAFTHGKDIYFDSGKYNPGNSAGKHLLAHELTHVVQQTAPQAPAKQSAPSQPSAPIQRSAADTSDKPIQEAPMEEMQGATEPAVQTKPTFDGASGRVQRRIQRAGSDKPEEKKKTLKDITRPDEGYIENKNTIVLTNFPLKKYDKLDAGETPTPPAGRIEKPKPGARATTQGSKWSTTDLKEKIQARLAKIAQVKDPEAMQMLSATGKGGTKECAAGAKGKAKKGGGDQSKTQVLGDLKTLARVASVPFWDENGNRLLHQIEHVIDWQVIGEKADGLKNNLILLDDKTNREQGADVRQSIIAWIKKIQAPYKKDINMAIVKQEPNDAFLLKYQVYFENLKPPAPRKKAIATDSIVTKSDLTDEKASILSKQTITICHPTIPPGHIVIKTSLKGEGYIVPINQDEQGKNIIIKGNEKTMELKEVKQRRIVKGGKNKKAVEGSDQPLKLWHMKDEKQPDGNKVGYYKLLDRGHAAELKSILKLTGLSPIEFDPEVEVSPVEGVTAHGKVKSDIPILRDADINFELSDGAFTVTGTVSSDALNGKLPKPLNIDHCDLTISASSDASWSVGGAIYYSIDKMGKGSLGAEISSKGFGLSGDFEFDESKYYKSAQLSIGYFREKGKGEGKWSGSGSLVFGENNVPGIKEGEIKLGYGEGEFNGSGHFTTKVPKLKKVTVAAKFDQKNNFIITGETGLENVPGIKDSTITVTVTRDETGYSLAVMGTATPNLPNIPGLGAELTVSYNNGVFTLQGKATYQKDKLEGSLTVGVTNAVVDDNGNPSKDSADNNLKIFGNGSITLHFLKGVDATLAGAVDAKGEMFIWGNMSVTATPFDPVDINKQIFSMATSIPLVGIPFASINLDLSASANFHFHWDPLTIHLEASLDRTNIKDIGKAGGELTATLSSKAEAGFMFKIGAGVSVSIAIIKLGAHINGAVDLGLKAEVGAEAKAKWDMQKGLQLEEAEAHLTGVPTVAFILSGDITADVDLWLTSYNVYKKEMTLAKKELDLSQFAFGVSIPLKINDSGKIEGIDYSKLKLTPELGKDAGDTITDSVLNGDDKKKKEQKEREAREKIRDKVVAKLQAKKADGETNLREYASDLKDDIKDDTPDELAGMVDEVVEEELVKMEKQQAAEDAAKAAAAQPPVPTTPQAAAPDPTVSTI